RLRSAPDATATGDGWARAPPRARCAQCRSGWRAVGNAVRADGNRPGTRWCVMLSRIAEALFWIGRYIERIECTARILDVYLQLLVEDPVIDQETTCRSILAAMGIPEDQAAEADQQTVLRMLLYDRSSPHSIAYAVE